VTITEAPRSPETPVGAEGDRCLRGLTDGSAALRPGQPYRLTQSREISTGVRARTPVAARMFWRSRDRNGGPGATPPISENV